ncbi:hypothetical protein EVAR_28892_1 [Eumeta japonica]|uniref:Uncharacterized protein n=1 Tax=Eumeta variegata TaxID=151549 RepID=A0A4C1X047_EUMVA|nr:hypothetical protein EVAR_28892_1 [Eumeta japonica]
MRSDVIRSYKQYSVPRCGMKPYCIVCSFGSKFSIRHTRPASLSWFHLLQRDLWDDKTTKGNNRPYPILKSPSWLSLSTFEGSIPVVSIYLPRPGTIPGLAR